MEAQSNERPPKWKAIVLTSVTIATKMSVLKKYPKDSLLASFSNRGSGHIGKGRIPRGCTVCVFFFVPKKILCHKSYLDKAKVPTTTSSWVWGFRWGRTNTYKTKNKTENQISPILSKDMAFVYFFS